MLFLLQGTLADAMSRTGHAPSHESLSYDILASDHFAWAQVAQAAGIYLLIIHGRNRVGTAAKNNCFRKINIAVHRAVTAFLVSGNSGVVYRPEFSRIIFSGFHGWRGEIRFAIHPLCW